MRKAPFDFPNIQPPAGVDVSDWSSWHWQMKRSFKREDHFRQHFELSQAESMGFAGLDKVFRVQTTPYYAALMSQNNGDCAIRKMVIPNEAELKLGAQQMDDPLGENQKKNRPCERLIHRYSDRALLLVTDVCGVYCRYCTRKHFTASDQVLIQQGQLDEAILYLHNNPQVREVLLSGGDPLTLSNRKLQWLLESLAQVPTVEVIRVGSRMPVACPMRIDQGLLDLFKAYKPIYLMTHFNHPDELTQQSAKALEACVDAGVPVMNQLVLLNGINNHPALISALNRRLVYLRVKPYYMFQADPSMGTDHLRTSIDESLEILEQLWGHSSGLSLPTYIVDIPNGGGKTSLSPQHQIAQQGRKRRFRGWDGVEADYISPPKDAAMTPAIAPDYQAEWNRISSTASSHTERETCAEFGYQKEH